MPVCPKCGAKSPTLAARCIKDGTHFIKDAAWQASRHDPILGFPLNQRFVPVFPIGSGNMGAVYEAIDLSNNQRIAIKVLRRDLTNDDVILRRFRREADAISRMRHRNIVQLQAFGQEGAVHFIAMELIDGRTLASFVPYANFSRSLTFLLIHQLLSGLAEAHQHGIIHRDLKPENVFICSRPDQPYLVKILDFGLAKLSENSEQTALTATGEVFGTPLYISPEQATAQAEISFATDIYTLGVMMYELLSGSPPFNAPTPLATMMQHVHAPPPPLQPRQPLLPLSPSFTNLVLQCLEKEPTARPQNALVLLDAFMYTPEMASVEPISLETGSHRPPSPTSVARLPSIATLEPVADPARSSPSIFPSVPPSVLPPDPQSPPRAQDPRMRTILYGQPAVKRDLGAQDDLFVHRKSSPYQAVSRDSQANLEPLPSLGELEEEGGEEGEDEEDTMPEPIAAAPLEDEAT